MEGIAIVRPMPSGRATFACAVATASMVVRMSGGKGAVLRKPTAEITDADVAAAAAEMTPNRRAVVELIAGGTR